MSRRADAVLGATPISTLDGLAASSPKRRVLSIGKALIAALAYGRANAWPLFIAAWFPCLLAALCMMALAMIMFSGLSQPPAWLLSRGFDPETWLSAILYAPFSAMVFAFVLDRMAGAPERGRVVIQRGFATVKLLKLPGLRIEISRRILLAALPLAAIELIFGFGLDGERWLFVASFLATHTGPFTPDDIAPWTSLIWAFNLVVSGILLAWTYLLVSDFLWTGSFGPARCWKALDGSHFRFIVVLFVVFTAVGLLEYGLELAGVLALVPKNGGSLSVPALVLVHFGLKWPFNLLHLVLSAVAVGTVLRAIERPAQGASQDDSGAGIPARA